VRAQNFQMNIVSVVSPGVANTEFSVTHTMDQTIPRGYMVFRRSKAGSLYRGPTAWTTTLAYLKSDTGNCLYNVAFFV
jgi:hypothetical protein